jgi:hypothetical protein
MHLFLEIVEGGSQANALVGRSIWLEPGDLCRFGSGGSNELVLPADGGVAAKAGTIVYDGKVAWLYDAAEARTLRCGDSFRVGAFKIRLRQYPPTGEQSDSPLGALTGWMRKLHGTGLYAIFDAARDPQVLDLLKAASGLKRLSLFDGDLRERMVDAAPYLVEIPKDSAELELLIRGSWGKGWATFLAAGTMTFDAMRAQLRRSLMVELQGGQKAYFRFFDPAVLQTFLAGSTPKEWAAFAGGIKEFIVEGRDNPGDAVRLIGHGNRIEVHPIEQLAGKKETQAC